MAVEVERIGAAVAILTLNRPDSANALSRGMLQAMNAALTELEADDAIRALVITGTGKFFCAGADLKERAGMTEPEVRQAVAMIGQIMSKVERFPVPVIAAINGAAMGGGFELALACDIRIAADSSRMGLTETSIGIIPGAGGTQRLPRIAGAETAKEMIFTAKRIDGKEAVRLGIVSRSVPELVLLKTAADLAARISENAPVALKAAKRAINEGLQCTIEEGLGIEEECYGTVLSTKDRLEGLRAFKEKRRPQFTGE